MNASSKGHLPVVLYLLTKQRADPLVRNNWGETAYDAAAAVFEVWICEVLQKAEAERWRGTTVQYNSLAVHTTVPLVLYENQRLDMRLKTLAMSGGRPRFSTSGLGKRGHRAPYELKLPQADDTGKETPAWRSDVQLPLRDNPWILPKPGAKDGSSLEGAERSHFWLSDWTLDVTHPGVDAEHGWQYAHSFDDPDDEWSSEPPPQLERLLSGSRAVAAGLSGSSSSSSSSSSRAGPSSRPSSTHAHQWVRRRRWVRVMRRRLDIPPLPYLQPDGLMYHLDPEGVLIPQQEASQDFGGDEGQELGAMPSSGLSSQDYVSRARYLAGTQYGDAESTHATSSALEVRRAIAKLERATSELRQGIFGDDDSERRTQAEVLLNAYSRELERRRLAAGAQGILITDDHELDAEEDDDSDDESFHYPGSSPVDTIRPPSVRSSNTDYFNRSSTPRGPTDLTPHLSQAPEFRVPTHEAPQKVLTRWTPTPHQLHAQWERDDAVSQCRECRRRFSFLNRRHHCRRCGRIFCDRCSSYRALLDPSEIIQDPAFPEPANTASSQRICLGCHEELTAIVPSGLHASRTNSMERIILDQRHLSIPSPNAETSSQISDLAECPVCNTNLAELGSPAQQEAHVRNCLEGGSGSSPQPPKYLVYKLPPVSALIGTECVICLEEFVEGSAVARLSCLCTFHNGAVLSTHDDYPESSRIFMTLCLVYDVYRNGC
ncbi:FYVE-domain-containing protein [Abortiporus biennis]|nr:FYVE-domain-containing protein [Abortiporus biennis]